MVAEKWPEAVTNGKAKWNTALDQLSQWLDNIPDILFRTEQQELAKTIKELRSQSDGKLSEAFDGIKSKIDDILDEIGRLLNPQGELVTPEGVKVPSNGVDEGIQGPMRIEGGSGNTSATPNAAVTSQLASDLGVKPNQINQALQVISPERVQQLHSELGQEVFDSLLKRSPSIIEKFSRAVELVKRDPVALHSLISILPPSKVLIPNNNLEQAVSEILIFLEKYQGRVSGDFPARFARKFRPKADPVEAAGELRFAEDFLEGQTARGNNLQIDGLVEKTDSSGQVIKGEQLPEYRLTTPDGQSFLAEVKTIEISLSRNGLQRNLQKAISQVKEESIRTGERGGFVRIDASSSPPTALTREEIERTIKGQLLTIDQKTGAKGSDFVEFVEVLYNDAVGQAQKLLARVQSDGNIVIYP